MWITIAVLALISAVSGAEIRANIPANLRECYNDSLITTRDNLLPFTVTTLIALVRKLEDSVTSDMRILSSAILHRYRFDGIQRNPEIEWSQDVIPYSPTGPEFSLYKVLFERLIPSTQPIPNNTLTYIEMCTLHAMLSSAMDPWDRGDNAESCSKIYSKYSSSNSWDWGGNSFRFPRDVSKLHDAEVFDPKVGPTLDEDTHRFPNTQQAQSGNYQQYMVTYPESQCPLENGVLYNKYGTISPGIVLAGITTGLQQENVNVRNLLNIASPRLRRPQQPTYRPSFDRPGQRVYFGSKINSGGGYGGSTMGDTVDNRYAATLAGVLAEVSLLLGPTMDTRMGGLKIGMSGGWNDTAAPKYYFVKDYVKNALSDPKIRGSIDGLLLAKEVKKWSDSTSGSLKLSQVLGMYYSDKGLFGTNVKACSRRDHVDEIAPDSELKDQASAFAYVLQDNLQDSVSITPEGIQRYVSTAADDTLQYIGSSFPERCPTQALNSDSTAYAPSVAADLHVVIDASYDFRDISKLLVYLADNMKVSKYSSNFSVINGFDGSIVVQSVQSPLDVYSNFSRIMYNSMRKGFDFDKLLSILRERFRDKLRYDSLISAGGGIPRVVLFIPQASANINNRDSLLERLHSFRVKLPDVKFLYLVSGSKDKFTPFAEEPDKDIFTVSVFTDVAQTLDPVIRRIASVPKRIINPKCGPTWSSSWYSSATIKGFLEKPEVHYYRIHPNYFYGKDTSGRITIRNEDHSQPIIVCSSRKFPQPVTNYTRPSSYTDANCKTLSGGQENIVSVTSDDCPDSYATNCQPHYFSVSSSQTTITQISNIVSCTDSDCEYPNMIKYTITHQGLGCYSGVGKILSAPFLVILLISISFLR